MIGKNTSLGAINITLNRPAEEFEGSISAQYNIEASEGFEVEGMVSRLISDKVRDRAVGDYRDVDGWVRNSVTGEDIQKAEDVTARIILDVDITENVTPGFMYQRSDFDRKGKA